MAWTRSGFDSPWVHTFLMKKDTYHFVEKVTTWIGSVPSLIIHTILFLGSFLASILNLVSWSEMLLVVTTIVSLEAIYLAIFIQMTVNRHTDDLREVSEDVEDIQEDLEEISEDVEDLQEDLEEMSEEEKQDEARKKRQAVSLEQLTADVKKLLADIEDFRERKT